MTDVNNFNLRVYGLWIHENHVLICHEERNKFKLTKFPGGGIEKGEGIGEALKREFIEELNLEIAIDTLFYVNDFLQLSAFNKSDQLISFYYLVQPKGVIINLVNERIFSMDGLNFEWKAIKTLTPHLFTFPIDKVVAEMLLKNFN